MMKTECHAHDQKCCIIRVSWTAVLVGALVGIGLSFLLNLFSIAIGLSAFTMSKEGNMTLAVGGVLGLLIGIIAAMFVSGFTAGYLGRPYCMKRHLGALYGFTAWCLALIFMMMFAAHIAHFLQHVSSMIANPATVVIAANVAPAQASAIATPDTTVIMMTAPAGGGMAMGAFIMFVFFAVGALAACFGGHCGMTCHKCDSSTS
ncbi:MAG: hypothetical protein EPO11_04660 [Gammaproteobacteria bacterium]|nr:MAG: hypothetical protein EPO11_04660 [Gammaproteobacteria bacterium]